MIHAALLLTWAIAAAPCPEPPAIARPWSEASLRARREALTKLRAETRDAACRQGLELALGETDLALGDDAAALAPLTAAALGPAEAIAARAGVGLGEAYARQGQITPALEAFLQADAVDATSEGSTAATALARVTVKIGLGAAGLYQLDPEFGAAPPPGFQPLAVAVARNGAYALVGERAVLSFAAGADQGVQRPLQQARAAAFAPGGDLWLATRKGIVPPGSALPLQKILSPNALVMDGWGRLAVIAGDEAFLLPTPTALPESLGRGSRVAGLRRGFAILDRRKHELRVVPKGATFALAALGSAVRSPEAIAADRFDNLYLLDPEARSLHVISPAGKLLVSLPDTILGVALDRARDLGVDGAGRIYVLGPGPKPVTRLH